VLGALTELGCSYEGANRSYIAVDVPPEVQLETVREFLISTGQQWEHADPPYEELFPDGNA
jgi:predicted acyl esterase